MAGMSAIRAMQRDCERISPLWNPFHTLFSIHNFCSTEILCCAYLIHNKDIITTDYHFLTNHIKAVLTKHLQKIVVITWSNNRSDYMVRSWLVTKYIFYRI